MTRDDFHQPDLSPRDHLPAGAAGISGTAHILIRQLVALDGAEVNAEILVQPLAGLD